MRAKALRRARRPGPAGNGRGGDGSLGAPAPGPQGESGLLPGCAGIMRSSPGPLRRRAFWRAWNGPGRRRSPKTPPPRPPRNTPKPPKPPRRNPGRYPGAAGSCVIHPAADRRGGVTLWHGRCARAAGSLTSSRRLPALPPGARTLRVPGRVGVLRPAGLPEPAPSRAPANATTGSAIGSVACRPSGADKCGTTRQEHLNDGARIGARFTPSWGRSAPAWSGGCAWLTRGVAAAPCGPVSAAPASS
jgi:hypothetical protein